LDSAIYYKDIKPSAIYRSTKCSDIRSNMQRNAK